ncbi:MAG: hypothetical protein ACRCXC_10190 [Legionella sp.]
MHQYWDNGAGFFQGQNDEKQIKNIVQQLEQKWSCAHINTQTSPAKWALSHLRWQL